MNETTTREAWLASLKAGDQVAMQHYTAGYHLSTVKRVTPAGRIVLENGDQFSPNGTEITSSKWGRWHLEEVTPEILASIKRERLVNEVYHELDKISNINVVRKLSNERLEELLAVLRKEEKQG